MAEIRERCLQREHHIIPSIMGESRFTWKVMRWGVGRGRCYCVFEYKKYMKLEQIVTCNIKNNLYSIFIINAYKVIYIRKIRIEFRKGELFPIFLSIDLSIDTLLYLIANMIMKIAHKVIFKVKYLRNDFLNIFSCASKQGGGGMGVASCGSRALLSRREVGWESLCVGDLKLGEGGWEIGWESHAIRIVTFSQIDW